MSSHKLVFKSPAAARATLKTLMEALASPDAVERNSAINNALASGAVWRAHGLTIRGAARIKHVLSALAMLNLDTTPLFLPSSSPAVIEWDPLSTTARIHTIRRVRPLLAPVFHFAIPVDTVLVFNADSAPSTGPRVPRAVGAVPAPVADVPALASGYVTEIQTSEAPSLLVTKWTEEWPLDKLILSAPWPMSIYLSVFRTLVLPFLVFVLLTCAEILHRAQEQVRHVEQGTRRTITHVQDLSSSVSHNAQDRIEHNFPTLYHYLPRHLPTPLGVARSLLTAPVRFLTGWARLLESSAQHTTEALNTILPARAQLPSPRLLEWYSAQHVRSLQRQHARARSASSSSQQHQQHEAALETVPGAEYPGVHAGLSADAQKQAPPRATPARQGPSTTSDAAPYIRRTRTRSSSTGSAHAYMQAAPQHASSQAAPASSWNEWPARPPSARTSPALESPSSSTVVMEPAAGTFKRSMSVSSSAEYVLGGNHNHDHNGARAWMALRPSSTIPAHRARDTSGMLATESATQPEIKRARHDDEQRQYALEHGAFGRGGVEAGVGTSGWMQAGPDAGGVDYHVDPDANAAAAITATVAPPGETEAPGAWPIRATPSSRASSLRSASLLDPTTATASGAGRDRTERDGSSVRSKKTVTFTAGGILPSGADTSLAETALPDATAAAAVAAAAPPAAPRFSPAVKTTFVGGADPEGALAAGEIKRGLGAEEMDEVDDDETRYERARHAWSELVPHSYAAGPSQGDTAAGVGADLDSGAMLQPPSASLAAEKLGAALVGEEYRTSAHAPDAGDRAWDRPGAHPHTDDGQGLGLAAQLLPPFTSPRAHAGSHISPAAAKGKEREAYAGADKETHIGDWPASEHYPSTPPGSASVSARASYHTVELASASGFASMGGGVEVAEPANTGRMSGSTLRTEEVPSSIEPVEEGPASGHVSEPSPRRRHGHMFARRSGGGRSTTTSSSDPSAESSSPATASGRGTGIRQKLSRWRSKAARSLAQEKEGQRDRGGGQG